MSTAQIKAQTTWEYLRIPLVAYGLVFGLYIALKTTTNGKFVWFSWHPLSMVVAFVTMTTNAALIKKVGGRDMTLYHGYLMMGSLLVAGFGWYVIHSNKTMFSKAHWLTLHGKFGAIFMVVYTIFGVGGAAALHPDWGVLRRNTTIRFIHKWLGRVLIYASWALCVQGVLKVAPNNWILQVAFVVPLLVFGFFTLV
jgi:hypothetical protein